MGIWFKWNNLQWSYVINIALRFIDITLHFIGITLHVMTISNKMNFSAVIHT